MQRRGGGPEQEGVAGSPPPACLHADPNSSALGHPARGRFSATMQTRGRTLPPHGQTFHMAVLSTLPFRLRVFRADPSPPAGANRAGQGRGAGTAHSLQRGVGRDGMHFSNGPGFCAGGAHNGEAAGPCHARADDSSQPPYSWCTAAYSRSNGQPDTTRQARVTHVQTPLASAAAAAPPAHSGAKVHQHAAEATCNCSCRAGQPPREGSAVGCLAAAAAAGRGSRRRRWPASGT